MNIISVLFVKSSIKHQDCPKPDKPEFAFIGRSNVGKSSLINMLTGRKKLAKISSTPGKTQLINHFLINNGWYMVDLPGYGWAKTSKVNKSLWEQMIQDYLLKRENLISVFVLIDVRLPPQMIDIEFVNWAGEHGIPFVILFTKADKTSKNKVQMSIAKFRKTLEQTWEESPKIVITSAKDQLGKKEILDYIEQLDKDISF